MKLASLRHDMRNGSQHLLVELVVGTVEVRRALGLDSNSELQFKVVFMLATKKMVQRQDRV